MLHTSPPTTTPLLHPDHERARVAAHIERAERAAGARDLSSLDRLTRIVRALLLDELSSYRRAGRFPKNPDFATPTPYFVDASGIRCAMAHLLEVGGEADLVAKITRERNNAYVRELVDEPRLGAWLAAAGITVAEAATIQPTYCGVYSDCVCGEGFEHTNYPVPANGVLEGTVTAAQADGRMLVRLDAVHGDAGTHGVGDSIEAYVYGAEVGAHVLVPIADVAAAVDGGAARLYGVELAADGTYTCSSHVAPRDVFIDAVTSTDCAATLAAADSHWADGTCGGGCSAGLGGSPSTLGILCAVVAALAARRAAWGATRTDRGGSDA